MVDCTTTWKSQHAETCELVENKNWKETSFQTKFSTGKGQHIGVVAK